jgi:hypothetical protein
MGVGDNVMTAIILIAPFAAIYSWFYCITRLRKEPAHWRNRASVASLVLTSLAAALWPLIVLLMFKLIPNDKDWGVRAAWAEAWHPHIFRALLAALVLSFLGRPRLIIPLALASIGTALFGVLSTAP